MKKLLIVSLSVAVLAAATITSTNNKAYILNGESCAHVGNHYSEVEATYEHNGVKEYWVCCTCHEHFLSQPTNGTWKNEDGKIDASITSTDDRYIPKLAHNYETIWTSDETSHWHKCTDEGYESVKGDEEEHYDLNGDYFCDECNYAMNGVEIISINMPVDRIGPGEHTTLSATVNSYGTFTGDIYWTLDSGNTARLTLVDNGDNTCTLTGLSTLDSGTVNNYTITAHSSDDSSITKSVTFYASTFPTTRIQAIIDLVGEDYVLPYCTFKPSKNFQTKRDYLTDSDYVQGYVSGSTGAQNVIKAFDNNGTYTKTVEYDHTYYTKDIAGTNFMVKYDIYVYGGSSYVDVYKVAKPLTEFPMDQVVDFLGAGFATKVIAPDDGSLFEVNEGYYDITVTCDCNASNYIAKLVAAGFKKIGGDSSRMYISSDRTLIVEVADYIVETDISFSAQDIPEETDWSNSSKNLMLEKLGEVLPFVNAGYGEWDYYSYYGYIYAYASMADAYDEAIRVFDANGTFTKVTTSEGVNYKKSISEYKEILVEINLDGDMQASISNKELTEWKADDIATALGDLTTVTLPVATGTSYQYEFGTNTATITIIGSQSTYEEALVAAGFIKGTTSGWTTTYESSDNTLTVVITNRSSTKFEIKATAHLPAGVTTIFPLDEVKAIIGSTEANNIIAASGTKFTLTENGNYDVTIKVEGGNKTAFQQALADAGFDSFMAGSYSKGNLCCDVSGTDPFTINYYLAEAPEETGFDWSTFKGDTLENPLKISNGMGGTMNFVIELDNGSIIGYTKNNRTNTLVTLTSDTIGCEENQLHLTGTDSSYNYLNYDFIIEYDEINNTIVLVSDNTISNW